MKKLFMSLLLMMLISLCACSSNSEQSSTNTSANFNSQGPNTTNNTEESVFHLTDEKAVDYSSYSGLLLEAEDGVGSYCTYSMYDINNDGIRELILKVGTCEADYFYHFYGLDLNLSTVELGTFSGSHSTIYADEEAPGIIIASGVQGFQTVSHITESEGKITSNTIIEGEIGAGDYYSNSSPLSICYIKDQSLLDKDAVLIGKELVFDENSIDQESTTTAPSFELLPITMNVIDMDFELACKKSNVTIAEVHPDNIRNIPIKLKDNQQLYCAFGNSSEYMIVEDGMIVGYITYNGSVSRDMSMKQYFPSDDCYNIAPQIIWKDTYAYCCWETGNSFLILGAISNPSADESGYYNWSTTTYILIKDFSQFNVN